ncbi:MAG TPA: class I SAM-dependent methyltransferase [Bacteroidota bacterium]
MQLSSLLGHTQELLLLVRKSDKPADSVIDSFFRSRKYLGSHDRRFIAETTYGTLRHLRRCEELARVSVAGGPDGLPAEDISLTTILAYLSRIEARTPLDPAVLQSLPKSPQLKSSFQDFLVRLPQAALETSGPVERLAVEFSLPNWLAERFVTQYGEEEAQKISESLNAPAPLNLRVNTLNTTVEECQGRLRKEGVETVKTGLSPVGLAVAQRLNIFRLSVFREGLFEVQDEGSQLLGVLLDPKPTFKVLDACAGAGGKTLHMAAIMKNRGEIVASDVNSFRLGELRKRARRAAAFNVRVKSTEELLSEEGLDRFFDIVFLDSPCSGIGTLRRNPGLKWSIRESDLEELRAKQLHILETHHRFVKDQGLLFYATCSLLPEENEGILEDFLNRHPEYSPVDLAAYAAKSGLSGFIANGYFKLFPHKQGTDGFFCGAVQRTGKSA